MENFHIVRFAKSINKKKKKIYTTIPIRSQLTAKV